MTTGNVAHLTCDKAQELIELAVRCRFITPQEQQEMLPRIQDQSKKEPKALLAPFLLKNKLLSKEKIQLLFSIKNHIDMLLADRQFGKMGIVNDFVSPEKVKKALDVQVKIFQKNKTSIKIGDILLQSQDITPADNTALLLTQDRIPDELLADALFSVAQTEVEQMEMEKRFGTIAVKKELITAGQLSQALKHQEKELKEKKKKPYLGHILKQLFNLSDSDITSVLKIQRKLEAKRMKLEEKLNEYNQQKEAKQNKLNPFFEYHVSEDRLTACIRKTKKPDQPVELSDFLYWFSLSGIKTGLCDPEKIQAFLDKDDFETEFEIARGVKPQPPREETVDFKFDPHFSNKKSGAEKKEGNKPPTVAVNDILAVVTPYKKGKPGTDVFGRPIRSPGKSGKQLSCGDGVIKKGHQFLAALSGHPAFDEKTGILSITPKAKAPDQEKKPGKEKKSSQIKKDVRPKEPLMVDETPEVDEIPTIDKLTEIKDKPKDKTEGGPKEINGDIASDTDDLYTNCDLIVMGNISPGVLVACNSLIINGDVLGNLSVSGDVEVKGNIGSIPENDGETIEPASVTANGRIQVTGNVSHAKIFAGNGLRAPKGDLISSNITACRDVMVNNILSNPKAPSTVRIIRQFLLQKAEIEKLETSIREAADNLDSLLQNDDLRELTKDLMRKKQAQDKYREKQMVVSYLDKILTDPDLEKIDDLDQKLTAFKESKSGPADSGTTPPDSAAAQQYMAFVISKIKDSEVKEQLAILSEFQDSAAGMYNAAEKAHEKLDKKYKELSKGLGKTGEKDDPGIDQAKSHLDALQKKKQVLLLEHKKAQTLQAPVVKVKNQVEPSTIIMGEKAKLIIEKAVYGVSFKEGLATTGKKTQILTDGYFE